MADMKPEDVKPITEIEKLIQVEGLLPARNPDSSWSLEGTGSIVPCIPAHEVGAIIKAAVSACDASWINTSDQFELDLWLAKADELEKMNDP